MTAPAPAPFDATYWTEARILDALRRYHEEYGEASPSKRYDATVRERCKGLKGPDRPYPDASRIRKRFPSMAAAWQAAGFTVVDKAPRAVAPVEDDGTLKRCGKCHEQKPRSAFYRNRTKHYGLADRCKECFSAGLKRAKGRPKGSGRKASAEPQTLATVAPAPDPLAARLAELEARVRAHEANETALLRVVGLLVEDGAASGERRELVRAGIAVGAMAGRR